MPASLALIHSTTVTGNLLLGGLPPRDRALLASYVEEIAVEPGDAILVTDAALPALFFPTSVLVSIEEDVGGAHPVEVGLVGREGLVGWPALLGCDRSAHAVVVQMRAGMLLRIPVAAVTAACRMSPTLWPALLRFVQIITIQMTRAIVSHLRDPVERRLSRWLLMRHDRVAGDELLVRHEEVSANLGVRRASITDSLHILEGGRLVRCHRGRILIRDRPGLERLAGDSYGVPEAHYRRLIAPFGKSQGMGRA